MSDRNALGGARHFPLSRDHLALAQAVEQIEASLTEAGCAPTEAQLFAAAAEEILVNVANHAWPPGEDRQFDAWLHLGPSPGSLRARLVVEDDGAAFDPTRQAPPPDVEADLDNRAIGGLGVHMVRQLTDEQRYARIGNRNVMEIARTFRIGSADAA